MSHLFLFANVVDDRINGEQHLGGEGAFAAAAIQILKETFSATVSYILAGKIEDDENGRFLKKTFERLGVDTFGLTIGGTQTCQAIIKGIQKAEFVGFEGGPICRFTKEGVERFSELLQSPGWFFFTSNTLYDNETWKQVQKILETSSRLLFFDINWREAFLKRSGFAFDEFVRNRVTPVLKRSQIIKGTQEELHQFKDLLIEVNPCWIVETRGNEGALLKASGREIFQETPNVEEVQDTGAGDTFSGSLLFDLARHDISTKGDLESLSASTIQSMLQRACHVGALTVQGFGVEYLRQNAYQLKAREK